MTCEMQWSGAVERMAAKFVVKGRSSEVAVAKIAPGSRLKLLCTTGVAVPRRCGLEFLGQLTARQNRFQFCARRRVCITVADWEPSSHLIQHFTIYRVVSLPMSPARATFGWHC